MSKLEKLRDKRMEIAKAMDEAESMPEFILEFNKLMNIAKENYEYRIKTEGEQ